MNDKEIEQKLRRETRALLEQGKVNYIIGFETGSLKFTTRPLIIGTQEDVDRLVFNPFIVGNLSVFLEGINERTGIIVKGCDSRTLVSLIQDKRISRDDVVILGVPCKGIIDLGKVEALVGKGRDEFDSITRNGDKVVVENNGEDREFLVSETLYDNCLGCECPTPREYDILLGEPISPAGSSERAASMDKIRQLKDMPDKRRWEYWRSEFEKCVRCYICRNICPACFCQRCFVEENEPQWLLPIPRWQENMMFQVIRNIHVAGRCVDCGECERACPAKIPLRSITREVYGIVDELFHYKPGMDKDALPLLAAYEATDIEDFVK